MDRHLEKNTGMNENTPNETDSDCLGGADDLILGMQSAAEEGLDQIVASPEANENLYDEQ